MTYRLASTLALALVLATAAWAQDVPVVGTPATLEAATWNIEHFGDEGTGPSDEERQLRHAARVIRESAVDVWGLQEVQSATAFARLLDSLGTGYGGRLAVVGDARFYTAFVYRTDVVTTVREVEQMFVEDDFDFAGRPPLKMTAEVTLPDTSLTVTFVTLHMKAFDDAASYERRSDAARRLKTRIDFTSLDREPIVVLGDFNDRLDGSIRSGEPSPYTNFLDDTDDYSFVTLPLDRRDAFTFCDNGPCTRGSVIDHILITDELFGAYVDGSADRMIELLDVFSGFVFNTSDHLPVYALFDFATGTSVASHEAAAFTVEPPFPNPAHRAATLRLTLDRPAPLQVDVYDALGRHVRTLHDAARPAGPHTLRLEVGSLPAGLYLVRVRAGAETRTLPLVLAR